MKHNQETGCIQERHWEITLTMTELEQIQKLDRDWARHVYGAQSNDGRECYLTGFMSSDQSTTKHLEK